MKISSWLLKVNIAISNKITKIIILISISKFNWRTHYRLIYKPSFNLTIVNYKLFLLKKVFQNYLDVKSKIIRYTNLILNFKNKK